MNKQDRQKARKAIQRRALTRRFIVYGIMGVFVAIFTAATVLLSEGYYFNLSNKQVIKNGLVFVDSKPKDAAVYINGNLEKDRTESRFTLPEGSYDFSVYKDGYRDWKRSFVLGGSEVVNLDYVLLLPKELKNKVVASYAGDTSLFSQSPDQKWIVVQHRDLPNVLDVIDTTKEDLSLTKLTLPATVFTADADVANLKVVQWSGDSQYLLLNVPFAGKTHFVLLHRSEQAKTVDLTKEFGIESKVLTLRDGKADKFYTIDQNDNLRDLNLTNKSISTPRFERALAYTSTGQDKLLVVQTATQGDGASYWLADKDAMLKIGDTTKQVSSDYLLELANYDGDWYVTYGSKGDQSVRILKNAFENIKSQSVARPLAKIDISAPSKAAVSKNSRFIAVQNDSQMVIFDTEFERTYRYATPVENNNPFTEIVWMDGARMVLASSGKQYLVDYDGINLQDLGQISNVGPVVFDRNTERMYSITPLQDGKSALTQTSLLVE